MNLIKWWRDRKERRRQKKMKEIERKLIEYCEQWKKDEPNLADKIDDILYGYKKGLLCTKIK